MKVGTVCVKIAGRDAGQQCIVVEELDNGMVLIEGATRRRKCNVKHLEPVGESKIKKGATHEAVMKELGLEPRKSKPRKPAARPRKKNVKKVKKTPAKETQKEAEEEPKETKKSQKSTKKSGKKSPKKAKKKAKKE